MKKENRKMAQQRRAEERRKKEIRRKVSKILAVCIPILVIILLVVIIAVFTGSNGSSSNSNNDTNTESTNGTDNTDSQDNTDSDSESPDEDSSEDGSSDSTDGSDNSTAYSTDTSLTVEDGDTVNIDYVGTVDGVEFDGGSTQGMGTDLVIGSGSYIDDFEDQLIGAHPGDTVEVNVTFPDPYSLNTDLSGAEAVFTVTINGIYE